MWAHPKFVVQLASWYRVHTKFELFREILNCLPIISTVVLCLNIYILAGRTIV